jgi:hypothetical protein
MLTACCCIPRDIVLGACRSCIPRKAADAAVNLEPVIESHAIVIGVG